MAAILAYDKLKCIFLNENDKIPIRILLTFFSGNPSNWQWSSTGSSSGLVPNRRQAITWTNVDLINWRICVALEGYQNKLQIDIDKIWELMGSLFIIQSSVAITRSNIVRYYIKYCRSSSRISIRCCIRTRHDVNIFEKIYRVITTPHLIPIAGKHADK